MQWFTETAPIRQKMLTVALCMTGLVVTAVMATLGAAVAGHPLIALAAGLSVAVVTIVIALRMREAICVPYVTTVVRMENLAAGDLDSPIEYTKFQDCVGRMTKAMFTFQETAKVNLSQAAAQEQLVSVLSSHLALLRNGDLTAAIEVEFPPEYALVKTNFNDAIDSIRGLITAVSEGTNAIQTGSMEIAQASEDLARRTEGNAASLEETSAALVQIDGRLKASVIASVKTVSRADQAIATVDSGRSTAAEAVAAMDRVRDSAKGIDDVIEGLDKIAFQTRVLAMNAAVEAGRAGDAGRGFAVVADLVSALAMRAEEEAKRARDQLTVTQAEVVTAAAAVQKVDGALSAISGDVGEVHALLRSMASDNDAQATGISQITVAVGEMDKSTQQNAAMVEETSAAARNLTVEVSELGTRAAAFNTGDRETATMLPGRTAAQPARMMVRPKAEIRLAAGTHVKAHANGHANGSAQHADSDWADF